MGSVLIRGKSPEGEDVMAKAARYRAQLTDSRKEIVIGAMIGAGYDVGTHGIKPPGKHGCKLPERKQGWRLILNSQNHAYEEREPSCDR